MRRRFAVAVVVPVAVIWRVASAPRIACALQTWLGSLPARVSCAVEIFVIDQLRTTHLTLLLICLVLVAANFAQQRGPGRLAYEDAVKIAELRTKPTGLIAEVRREVESAVSVDEPNFSEAPDLAESPSIDVTLKNRTVRTISRTPRFVANMYAGQEAPQLVRLEDIDRIVYWPRLSDFIETWDTPIVVFRNPLRIAPFLRQALTSNCGSLTVVPSKTRFEEDHYEYDIHAINTHKLELRILFDKPGRTVDEEPATCSVSMPLNAHDVPFDIRETIRNVAGAHWPIASFRDAFKNLDESTKYLKSLSPNDLVGRLNDEANREGEKVELFGAKIPFELVSVFGSLLLVSCQFYLWCHVVESRTRLRRGIQATDQDTSGYIGFYGDQIAVRVFVTVTVFILPAAVQCFTLWRTKSSPYIWLSPALGAPISVAFGLLLCFQFREMWTTLRSPAPTTPVEQLLIPAEHSDLTSNATSGRDG